MHLQPSSVPEIPVKWQGCRNHPASSYQGGRPTGRAAALRSTRCPAQVPALRKHLQETLKSEKEFLAGADASERHPAQDAARPGTPPPQEQQLRQAHVSSHPVETVCVCLHGTCQLLWMHLLRSLLLWTP